MMSSYELFSQRYFLAILVFQQERLMSCNQLVIVYSKAFFFSVQLLGVSALWFSQVTMVIWFKFQNHNSSRRKTRLTLSRNLVSFYFFLFFFSFLASKNLASLANTSKDRKMLMRKRKQTNNCFSHSVCLSHRIVSV